MQFGIVMVSSTSSHFEWTAQTLLLLLPASGDARYNQRGRPNTMPKPFDATLKTLYEVSPIDFPRLCGYPAEQVSPIDAETSIVSGAADKAVRVAGNPDWIMHVEFQSGPDQSLPGRMNLDSLILHDRTDLHVRSAVILLHRKANLRTVNGRHTHQFANDAEPYRTFQYQVIRLWELPVETLLQGGLSCVGMPHWRM